MRWTTHSCWHNGQRLFCFTHNDMQQLWNEWLQSPHTTGKEIEKNIQTLLFIHPPSPSRGKEERVRKEEQFPCKSDIMVPNRCMCYSWWNKMKSSRDLFNSKILPLSSHVIGCKIWRSKPREHYHAWATNTLLPACVFMWHQINTYDVGT